MVLAAVSEEAVAQAVIGVLGSAFPYDVDDVPGTNGNAGTLPTRYTEVTVSRRYGGPVRGDATPTTIGYRITTRAVAKNVTDARNLRRLAMRDLENVALTVGAEKSTPVAFESADPIGPDAGWFSGLVTWTTTL